MARQFFTLEALGPFLLGALCLSILGNAVTQLLFNWAGQSSRAVALIAIGVSTLLALAVLLVWRGLSRRLRTCRSGERHRRPAAV
ncbi:MAG: hypothetical protein U0531_21490 [Dehalococcoidia bacterium]